uniref:Uncharacterized protein n=1 Tax=Avena sativa TaxID=4498 RepID=A0ACD5WUJ1_AVESA
MAHICILCLLFHMSRTVIAEIPNNMVEMTLLVAWRARYGRNEATHDKPLPSLEGSRRFLSSYLRLIGDVTHASTDTLIKGKQPILEDGITRLPGKKEQSLIKPWSKPPDGWVKLSVDGSFREADHMAAIGMVLHDNEGSPIFSSCRFLDDCASPLEAELQACLEGLERSTHFSQLPIIVESDCAQMIEALKSRAQDRSPLLHLIAEIKTLSCQNRMCHFVKVELSQVRVSHYLANFARTERRTATWLGSGPDAILQELEHDRDVTLPV